MRLIDVVLALQDPDATPDSAGNPGTGALVVVAVMVAGALVAYWRLVLRVLAVVVVAIALVGLLVVVGAGSGSGPLHDLTHAASQAV